MTNCQSCNREVPAGRECPACTPVVTRKFKWLALACFLSIALAFCMVAHAQDTKAAPAMPAAKTEDPAAIKTERDALKAENALLKEKIRFLQTKADALLNFYGADEGVRNVDKQLGPAPIPQAPAK